MKYRKICYILSEAISAYKDLGVLEAEIRYLSNNGWQVTVICGKKSKIEVEKSINNLSIKYVNLIREPSLWHDILALIEITVLLLKNRPNVSYCTMPKGSFIGMIASWILCVPKRIYVVSAAKFETMPLKKIEFYIFLERITCALSTETIFASKSLRHLFLSKKIANHEKSSVLGIGSVGGVDSVRFERSNVSAIDRDRLKSNLNFTDDDIILGYFGRINKDKGIEDLVQVYIENFAFQKNLKLLILGDFDSNNAVSEECKETILKHPSITFRTFAKKIELYYSIIDIFVLPTYREGFPTVILEALSMGIPVISTDATGAKDAFEHNISGLMYNKGDKNGLRNCIELLTVDPELRCKLGNYGYKWVRNNFNPQNILQKLEEIYEK